MEKPDWAFLLKRYGLGENFDVNTAEPTEKKKIGGYPPEGHAPSVPADIERDAREVGVPCWDQRKKAFNV